MSKLKKSNKKDQYTVVLEDINSQFKIFGDLQMGMNEKLDSHTEMIGSLMEDMAIIKTDIEFIKGDLKKKVDWDHFSALERRVVILERRRR
ncbi:MAG TPA: hypothetical protein VJJ24_02195 [Candidatus Paceibacterota bacterium]